jgi:serine/threonine protein kinase
MKQLEHKHILPFYGVSTTVSDFCLVFPWCSNGNIVEYLKKHPDINQFELASTLRQITSS